MMADDMWLSDIDLHVMNSSSSMQGCSPSSKTCYFLFEVVYIDIHVVNRQYTAAAYINELPVEIPTLYIASYQTH